MAPRGKILFGYFFGPRLPAESDATLDNLRPEAAVHKVRFGDLGLIRRDWPVLGVVPGWKRSDWPIPSLARRDPLGKLKPILVEYSDQDPSRRVSERIVQNADGLQSDSLSGYGAVSIVLDKLLQRVG
jgi:hypothetical protein